MSITVLLVDDEQMIRAGLRLILETDTTISVVGEASDGRQAIRAVASLHPDVVLMDIRMATMDGVTATHEIVANTPATAVLMLTTFDDDTLVNSALRAGARGFLLKVASPERLIDAVHVVASGEALLDPTVTRRLIAAFARTPDTSSTAVPAEVSRLTTRERDVLDLLTQGMSNNQIATALGVGDANSQNPTSPEYSPNSASETEYTPSSTPTRMASSARHPRTPHQRNHPVNMT